MGLLQGWAGLILGFSGLIFIHELGHFLLAKWNGVRVYVFSLGMGPYLVSFTWRGTVYALSMIPIGGYVKLMGQDDMNANLEPSKDKSDYRNKRPGQKAAILAAGAIFNIIFTIFAFTLAYSIGIFVEPALIGNISPDKPLAKAQKQSETDPTKLVPANLQEGDKILAVNGVPVKTFLEAMLQISGSPRNEQLMLLVERKPKNPAYTEMPQIVYVTSKHDEEFGAQTIGLEHYFEKMKLPLGFTTEDSLTAAADPAPNTAGAEAGLKAGDELIEVAESAKPEDKREIKDRDDLVNVIRACEGRELTLTIRRDGNKMPLKITPKQDESGAYKIGVELTLKRVVTDIDEKSEAYAGGLRKGNFIYGFKPDRANEPRWASGTLMYWPDKWDPKKEPKTSIKLKVPESAALVFTQERPATEKYKAENIGAALAMAWDDTLRFSSSVFTVIKGLITRNVNTKALSGALGIGGVMFTVARTQDFLNFLWMLGFISLNLGVLQFVPIPLLDGWHLLMVAIEKIKGRPVPAKIQEAFQYVGLFIVGSLLLLATYNDIRRFFM